MSEIIRKTPDALTVRGVELHAACQRLTASQQIPRGTGDHNYVMERVSTEMDGKPVVIERGFPNGAVQISINGEVITVSPDGKVSGTSFRISSLPPEEQLKMVQGVLGTVEEIQQREFEGTESSLAAVRQRAENAMDRMIVRTSAEG